MEEQFEADQLMLGIPPSPVEARVVLASNSPRRRDLLAMIVPNFDIAPSRDVDESYDSDTDPRQVPILLSQIKSAAYADLSDEHTIVITADTVVICNGRVLGKPANHAEACDMLAALSGHQHEVVTGVTLRRGENSHSFSETTRVYFDRLSDTEIEAYVNRFRPYDKAGAYGIQEWIGCIGIKGIEGCFYNVMGLPLHHLYHALSTI